jgi:hypothetical protein
MLHSKIALAACLSASVLTLPAHAQTGTTNYGPGQTVQDSSKKPVIMGRVLSEHVLMRQTTSLDWISLFYNVAGYFGVTINNFTWVNDGPACGGTWYLVDDSQGVLPSRGRVISSETPGYQGAVKSGTLVYAVNLKPVTAYGQSSGPYPLTNPVCDQYTDPQVIVAGTGRSDTLPTITPPVMVK